MHTRAHHVDPQAREDVAGNTPAEPEILLSALVVSDLHIVGTDTVSHARDSLMCVPGADERFRNPLEKLMAAARTRQIEADLVVCCGDLTNRAGMDGFKYGWEYLEALARELGSPLLFTPGNHDLDVTNRHGKSDPSCVIKSVYRAPDLRLPRITTHDLATDGFELYRPGPDVLIVNIDSNGPSPTEHGGRIGDVPMPRIDMVKQAIKDLEDCPSFGILLCHHHPYRHGDIDQADYSALNNAPELFNALRDANWEIQWFFLHGHKHHPRLARIDNFTVMAAGSCSASLSGRQGAISRNQYYIVDFLRDPNLGEAHPVVGRIRSWDWWGVEWRRGQVGFGIPDGTGFGAVSEPFGLANDIADFVREGPALGREVHELVTKFPQIQYLIPAEEIRLRELLLARYRIEVLARQGEGKWRRVVQLPN